jgi:hypothetical protein
MSGIPEVMAKYPRCELFQSQQTALIARQRQHSQHSHYNLNSLLRPLIYSSSASPGVLHLDEETSAVLVHPSLLEDHIDANASSSSLDSPSVTLSLKAALQCYYCKKIHQAKKTSSLMIYCPLCRKRCVQSPHIYCSRHCLLAHRHDHSSYHETTQSEHLIIHPSDLPDPHQQPLQFSNTPQPTNTKKSHLSQQIRSVQFQRVYLSQSFGSSSSTLPHLSLHDDQDAVRSSIESEFQQEVYGVRFDRPEIWIAMIVCFYLLCWFLLWAVEGDRGLPDHIHDEM